MGLLKFCSPLVALSYAAAAACCWRWRWCWCCCRCLPFSCRFGFGLCLCFGFLGKRKLGRLGLSGTLLAVCSWLIDHAHVVLAHISERSALHDSDANSVLVSSAHHHRMQPNHGHTGGDRCNCCVYCSSTHIPEFLAQSQQCQESSGPPGCRRISVSANVISMLDATWNPQQPHLGTRAHCGCHSLDYWAT